MPTNTQIKNEEKELMHEPINHPNINNLYKYNTPIPNNLTQHSNPSPDPASTYNNIRAYDNYH